MSFVHLSVAAISPKAKKSKKAPSRKRKAVGPTAAGPSDLSSVPLPAPDWGVADEAEKREDYEPVVHQEFHEDVPVVHCMISR